MQPKTPKEKFLSDKDKVAKIQRIVDDSTVIEALDATMLQYVESFTDSNEPAALANYYRIQGARKFKSLFLTFPDLPTEPKTKSPDALDPSAETFVAPRRERPPVKPS